MRPLRALLIYTLVVFVGGALLAPWLYQLVHAVAPNSHLAQNPFHRYVDRALLGLALIGIWPLLRGLGATSWRETGFVKPSGQWKRLGAGFALGFGSLACVAAIVLAAHGRQINPDLTAGPGLQGPGHRGGNGHCGGRAGGTFVSRRYLWRVAQNLELARGVAREQHDLRNRPLPKGRADRPGNVVVRFGIVTPACWPVLATSRR